MATWHRVTPAPTDAWGPLPPHAAPPRRLGALHWLERLLLVVAMASLGYYSYVSAETALYQAYEHRELDKLLRDGAGPPVTTPAATGATASTATATRSSAPRARRAMSVSSGSRVGRIEIPRLGVSAVVRAGVDSRTLDLAVGHIPGTAFPGEQGNVGLAGHRDTFFRRLKDIREDDEIRVVTKEGTYSYRVARTTVVDPKDVWVLDPTEQPALTLVTCFPFTYIGSAPQRFIVRAHLVR